MRRKKEFNVFVRIKEPLVSGIISYCQKNEIPLSYLGLANVVRGIVARYLREYGYISNLQSKCDEAYKIVGGGRMKFVDIVRETLIHFIKQNRQLVKIDEIKLHLLVEYDMRSLNYPGPEKKILQNFVDIAKSNGWIESYEKNGTIKINSEWFELIKLKLSSGENNVKEEVKKNERS